MRDESQGTEEHGRDARGVGRDVPGSEIQRRPPVLTFRAWNPEVESWNDYKGALERAYAPYLDGHRRTVTAEQTGHDPEPETLDPDGTGP